ncbi:monocarboxylate transporter 12 isoform X3 [Homalodisca vitripennis]|nr:monocarboxylate transporter 12 isoform X3 [Homalodisca vitripennis]
MSALDAVINFSGFLVGPLIKKYSFRKVAFMGAALSATALMATAPARSMTHIFITYSLMGGLGFGLATSSTFVALNSYFSKKRGQAVGLAMTGTALGFMAMPQIISRLLEEFEFCDTMLIIGALGLNALVGASLLQPVKWHLRSVVIEEETLLANDGGKAEENENELKLPQDSGLKRQVSQTDSCCSKRHTAVGMPRNSSNNSFIGPRKRKTSTISNVSHVDLMGSTMHVHIETDSEDEDHEHISEVENGQLKSNNNSITKRSTSQDIKKGTSHKDGCWHRFSSVMDFDLLLNVSYLNILFGLSLSYIAEMNFKLIIPFFMANLGYTKRDTAQALTMMAVSDLVARVVMPPIYDRLSYSRKSTLMFGLTCVAIARSVLAEQTSWTRLMAVLVIHGFFRGFTLINNPLVISEAVAPVKFPAAYGLSMVAKGIFIVALGPLAGWVRDFTGSYSLCLHIQSLMIMISVLVWFIEHLLTSHRKPETVEPS